LREAREGLQRARARAGRERERGRGEEQRSCGTMDLHGVGMIGQRAARLQRGFGGVLLARDRG
jgi:hypothetical protein